MADRYEWVHDSRTGMYFQRPTAPVPVPAARAAELRNPAANAKFAVALMRRHGLDPWTGMRVAVDAD